MMPEVMVPETPSQRPLLQPAPRSIHDSSGYPAFGTYQGELDEVDLTRLSGSYRMARPRRLLKEKKWQYGLVVTPELVAAYTVADLSYTANAFVYAVDLREKRPLVDRSFLGMPGPLASVGNRPGRGFEAHFTTVNAAFRSSRLGSGERYRCAIDVWDVPLLKRALRWEGEVLAVGGAPALSVIAPAGNGMVNVTQKQAGMLAFGTLHAGGRRYPLDGGVAGLDYTHGYLPRHTTWRWAMACGRLEDGTPVGINLVEGFNDDSDLANENALWMGSRLYPLGRARFSFSKRDPLDEWHVTTTDGELELRFRPVFVHREERDLKLVKSRFLQPVGTFTGSALVGGRRIPLSLGGVTEEQDVLW
ncbi:MAG TPA: DUF2804 domain-containing protein [Myxococcales bacterium]|jgi:hypothetical protein|nr:DUF2804 domain-containing protein [Myxococcales bacterium]